MNIRNGLFWDKKKEHRKAQLTKEVKKKGVGGNTPQSRVKNMLKDSLSPYLFTLFAKARMQIGDNVQSLSKVSEFLMLIQNVVISNKM